MELLFNTQARSGNPPVRAFIIAGLTEHYVYIQFEFGGVIGVSITFRIAVSACRCLIRQFSSNPYRSLSHR